jgi:hypothetical protein
MTLSFEQDCVLKLLNKKSPRKWRDLNRMFIPNFTDAVLIPLVAEGMIRVIESIGCVDPDCWSGRNCSFGITDTGREAIRSKA